MACRIRPLAVTTRNARVGRNAAGTEPMKDRELGMNRPITRRDFVDVAAVAIANSDAVADAMTEGAFRAARLALENLGGG